MNISEIKRIGVVGAGVMGHGIAQIFAQRHYKVVLFSRSKETLQEAMNGIRSNLTRLAKNGIIPENSIERTVSRIKPSTRLKEAMADTDFVVEAVAEDLNVKRSIFQSLESTCAHDVILATNTSGFCINEIASVAERPERILGTHFWNPPHIIPLVEVTKGDSTSQENFEMTCKLMELVGKVPARVLKDIPGFIGNRIQHAMYREIFALLDNKVATAEDIDKVVMLTFGGRLSILGPLTIADLNGVHLFQKVQSYLLKYINRSTEPAAILNEMTARGEIGAKTGKGFYTWDKEKTNEVTAKRDDGLIGLFRPYLNQN